MEKLSDEEIFVKYEKSYLLFSVLSLLKEKNQIKEFMYFTIGMTIYIFLIVMMNLNKRI